MFVTMIYRWRSGVRFTIKAQLVGEAVEAARDKCHGLVSPAQLVEFARDKQSAIHDVFVWGESEAAQRHREGQARRLIGALVVVMILAGEERETRAFASITRGDITGYTTLQEVISDTELRNQVINRARQELLSWSWRYKDYEELSVFHKALSVGMTKWRYNTKAR